MVREQTIKVWEAGIPRTLTIGGNKRKQNPKDCTQCINKITKLQALKENLIDEQDFDNPLYSAVCRKRSTEEKGYLLDTKKKRTCRTFQSIQQDTLFSYLGVSMEKCDLIEKPIQPIPPLKPESPFLPNEDEEEPKLQPEEEISCEFLEKQKIKYKGREGIIAKKIISSNGTSYKIEYLENGKKKFCWISEGKLEEELESVGKELNERMVIN